MRYIYLVQNVEDETLYHMSTLSNNTAVQLMDMHDVWRVNLVTGVVEQMEYDTHKWVVIPATTEEKFLGLDK